MIVQDGSYDKMLFGEKMELGTENQVLTRPRGKHLVVRIEYNANKIFNVEHMWEKK